MKTELLNIRVPKSKAEKVFNIVGYTVYGLAIIFLIIKFFQLPDEIPAHFNLSGEVTRWGSKIELIILPIIGTFTILLTEFFERNPQFHNYPSRLTKENAAQFYFNSRRILNQMKNIMALMFAYLIIEIIFVSEEKSEGLGSWPMTLFLIALFIPIIFGLIRQSKIK